MGLQGRDLFLVSPELSLVLLGALVILLDLVLKRRGAAVIVAMVGLLVPIAAGISLWDEVHRNGAELGFNDSLVVDKFALYFKFLIIGILALVFLAGSDYLKRFRPYEAEFVGLVLFSSAGLMLLPASADLITLYVSLELASLPIVALAAFLKTQVRSLEAGMKYLILSAISSAVLLYGFTFIYAATGTIRLIAIDGGPTIAMEAARAATADAGTPFGSMALMAGAVMAAAGFGFKLSMVPFQMWTPDVYEGAPTPVVAFLAVASKAAAFAVVLRLFYSAFPGDLSGDWSMMFAVLAVITMSVGNLVAIVQSNIRRLLGYSTIAQAGYMLIGVAAVAARSQEAADDILGISSVLFYLGGYAAMNLAAFFAVIVITSRTGDEKIEGLAGMGYRSPAIAAVLAVALLSLTGIPPTVGFMGKLFLFNAAVNADMTWLAVIGVVNSVVSAYYYVGILRTMYLRPAEDDSPVWAGIPERIALGVTAVSVVVLGLWPGGLLDVAQTAAGSLV
jgi:NADH-quinone oxidoreductase subunit N